MKDSYSDAEKLIRGMLSGYLGLEANLSYQVCIEMEFTTVHCGGMDWVLPLLLWLQNAGTTHGKRLLMQAQPLLKASPERLLDAWDTEKRSREYLNSEMDKFDLDNVYFGHAYIADA